MTREPQVGDLETLGRCSRRWQVMCTCWGGGDFGKVIASPIFIDTNQLMNYTVSPLYNGLADHGAQLLIRNDIHLQLNSRCIYTTRSFNTYSVKEFITKLSYESWGNIFSHTNNLDVDTLFNAFLSDYLRLFYTSFPICKKST